MPDDGFEKGFRAGYAKAINDLQRALNGLVVSAETPRDPKNFPIEDLGLPVRPYNLLKRNGIQTVGDLIEKSEIDLLDIRNLGGNAIKHVKEKLAQYGYSLR